MHKGIICGRGGQGIITVNRMLGEIASRLGLPVISAETHGMAMRGGSVATYIKIGNFHSPSIGEGEADFMIATDLNEAERNLGGCAAGACLVIDSPKTPAFGEEMKIITIDASRLAREKFGSEIASGSILLGAFLAHNENTFDREKVVNVIKDIFPKAAASVDFGYEVGRHA